MTAITVSSCPAACSSRNVQAPDQRAEDAAADHHQPHLHVDPAAPEMRDDARHAGAGHLAGGRRGGDGRRDAIDDQQRRRQEPAADAEHARQQADAAAEQHDHQRVDRQIGDGEVQVHGGARYRVGRARRLEAGAERQRRARAGAGAAGDAQAVVGARAGPLPPRDRQRSGRASGPRSSATDAALRRAPATGAEVDRDDPLARTARTRCAAPSAKPPRCRIAPAWP